MYGSEKKVIQYSIIQSPVILFAEQPVPEA